MVAVSTISVWRGVPPGRHRGRMTFDDATAERWMQIALAEAGAAAGHGDVPVGAVLVAPDGTELARGRNRREQAAAPPAHAELEALRAAAAILGTWRLDGSTLVVTLEPCAMCAGALVQARVARLVFAADDPRAGAVTSLFDLVRDPRLPPRVEVHPPARGALPSLFTLARPPRPPPRVEVPRGALAADSAPLLRSFFTSRRYTP